MGLVRHSRICVVTLIATWTALHAHHHIGKLASCHHLDIQGYLPSG